MQAFRVFVTIILTFSCSSLRGQSSLDIQKLESSGDTLAARTALARAAEANPSNIAALTQYAEFMERYGDPAAREAYTKLLTALQQSGDKQRAGVVAHRLAALDLLAGDREATARSLDAYRQATGKNLAVTKAAALAETWP